MRHVSRTHKVTLDWLFDRTNLDPKIEIKCNNTKNQLADILTKGNFPRVEWNNLLRLFHISNHSSSNELLKMAKRVQDGKGEERAIAKARPTMDLVSETLATSLICTKVVCIKPPGALGASSKDSGLIPSIGKPVARGLSQNEAASSPQVWHTNTTTTSEGSTAAWKAKWQKDHQISEASELYHDEVLPRWRRKMGRETLDDLDTNSLTLGLFMSTSLEAAVHLGTDCLRNLQATRNQPDRTIQHFFNVCQRLIHDQTEIAGLT